MLQSSPFPLKQSELNQYFHTVTEYLQVNSIRMHISDRQLAALTNLLNDWSAARIIYYSSQNRNKAVYNLSLAMDAMQNALKAIYSELSTSVLSELDLDTLHLHNFCAPQESDQASLSKA